MYVRSSGFRKTLLWLQLLLILRLLESLETFSTLELWLFSNLCRQERMKGVFLKLRFLSDFYTTSCYVRWLLPRFIVLKSVDRWFPNQHRCNRTEIKIIYASCTQIARPSTFLLFFFFATGSSTGWSKSSTEIMHNVISWGHSLRLLRNLIWPFFICLLPK